MHQCIEFLDPQTKMQSFVYQLLVVICTFLYCVKFNLCLGIFKLSVMFLKADG